MEILGTQLLGHVFFEEWPALVLESKIRSYGVYISRAYQYTILYCSVQRSQQTLNPVRILRLSIGEYRVKATWRGPYRGGEIVFESEDLKSLDEQIDQISQSLPDGASDPNDVQIAFPKLSGNVGCSEAIRQALATLWGRMGPRTMAELQRAFETNALFFSTGTLSGLLNHLTKTGDLRRLDKAGKWGYVLVKQDGNTTG